MLIQPWSRQGGGYRGCSERSVRRVLVMERNRFVRRRIRALFRYRSGDHDPDVKLDNARNVGIGGRVRGSSRERT